MNRLKKVRVLSELTQANLAKQSGVSLYRIQRIEYGWSRIKDEEAKKISKIVGCKTKDLIEL